MSGRSRSTLSDEGLRFRLRFGPDLSALPRPVCVPCAGPAPISARGSSMATGGKWAEDDHRRRLSARRARGEEGSGVASSSEEVAGVGEEEMVAVARSLGSDPRRRFRDTCEGGDLDVRTGSAGVLRGTGLDPVIFAAVTLSSAQGSMLLPC